MPGRTCSKEIIGLPLGYPGLGFRVIQIIGLMETTIVYWGIGVIGFNGNYYSILGYRGHME